MAGTLTVDLVQRMDLLEQRVDEMARDTKARMARESYERRGADTAIFDVVWRLDQKTVSTSLWALPLVATGIVFTGLDHAIGTLRWGMAWLLIGIGSTVTLGALAHALAKSRGEVDRPSSVGAKELSAADSP